MFYSSLLFVGNVGVLLDPLVWFAYSLSERDERPRARFISVHVSSTLFLERSIANKHARAAGRAARHGSTFP